MAVNTFTGRALYSFQVSTDDTIPNLKELKLNVLDTFTYNDGRQTALRTRGGDATERYQEMKPGPFGEFTLEPDTHADAAVQTVLLNAEGDRVFVVKYWDGSLVGNDAQGLTISGRCTLHRLTLVYGSADGDARIRGTLYPVGADWSKAYGNL